MKKTSLILFLFLFMLGHLVSAQEQMIVTDSVDLRLQQQLIAFPQEKIYVQTDKSSYLSGERIWLRAHMVDAFTACIYQSLHLY